MQISEFWTRIMNVCGSQTSPVVLCTQYSVISTRITRLYGSQRFCKQNSDFRIRLTSLYVSQTWPGILCMYKTVLSIRITSLYGSQPSSVVFACKTVSFGPELQVSMGTRPHPSFCACKSACLASEILVSMGSSPHLCFLHANQRVLDSNNECLCVPDITCRFVHAI